MVARAISATVLAAALAWTGMGAAKAATPPDPCKTVAKADVAKALGAAVTSATPRPLGPSASCAFHGPGMAQAVVTAFRYDSVPEAQARFSDMVKQTGASASSPAAKVTGVGDEAVTIISNVYTRKGTDLYVFNIFGRRGPALTARVIALAKATMSHVK